jgi:hypothetical protein
MTRDMKEQNYMIGRNKNKNMLEQKPKEQKHMFGRKQKKHYHVTAWNKNSNTLQQNKCSKRNKQHADRNKR